MKYIQLTLYLIGIVLISACVQFNEVSLSPSAIKSGQEATLWMDIKNTDPKVQTGNVIFTYPATVTIMRNEEKITSYPFTLDENGGTLGRTPFRVTGQYISGQPESKWNIKVSIEVEGQIKDSREIILTVNP